MKQLFVGLLLAVALAAAGCAPAGTSASLQIRSAPPPPSFQFNDEPRFNLLADRNVSVIADDNFGYDMFSSGGNYYLYNGGYWYSSSSARGQFVAVDSRRVPKQVFKVNDKQYRWRSHPAGWKGGDNNQGHHDNGGPGH